MSWRDGELLGLDLETTGTDPTTALPIAFALVWFGGGEVLKRRYGLIDPGVEIPAEATAVHGISTETAQVQGLDPVSALAEIAGHCRDRMNAPGRSGMTRAAAGLILGLAEGSSEEDTGDG